MDPMGYGLWMFMRVAQRLYDPRGASVPWEVGDGRDGAPRAAVQLEGGVGGRQGALQQRPRWPQ